MIETTLSVQPDAVIGTISPRLYGHFAEHLGRCCYGGLWAGTGQTAIPHQNGFHSGAVEALRALPVPLLRWPGGCYADHYHWRDGIGPAAERRVRIGMSCDLQVEDDNSLGTHEFMALCRLLGAEPYLAGNVGTGTPQELCDWLEYCNTTVNTTLARERTSNGSPAPFGVRLWGVGNENWGCGGQFDADDYAREYRRYATMLRHVDPAAELVACGHTDSWNRTFLETNQRFLTLVDHLSIHNYWIGGGPEVNFTEEQYYGLLVEADATEAFVRRTADMVHEVEGKDSHRIGIALDEWGVWHPEARAWGPNNDLHRAPITYEQAGTLRDALAVAVALEGFHRQCDVLTLANLAQMVNVLHAPVMTEGASAWVTPTYYALQMHAPHIGSTAVRVEVNRGVTMRANVSAASAVSATASVREGSTAITLVNRHYDQEASVQLSVPAGRSVNEALLLTAENPRATNSLQEPDRVKPAALSVHADGVESWRLELPPHAMATVVFGVS
jgi:alpha-N-arabinofuranosidase